MSVQAISWALKQELPSATKFVLVALANYSDQDGICWPSQASLAADTSTSDRHVRRHLKVLEDRGFITRTKRQKDSGFRNSDMFQLVFSNRTDVPVGDNPTGQPVQSNRTESTNPTGQNVQIQPEQLSGEPSVEPSEEPSEEPSTRARARFDEFWLAWDPFEMPKGSKQGADMSWQKHVVGKGVDQGMVIDQAKAYCAECRRMGTKTKHAVTWLNNKLWNEEYGPPMSGEDMVYLALQEKWRREDASNEGGNSGDRSETPDKRVQPAVESRTQPEEVRGNGGNDGERYPRKPLYGGSPALGHEPIPPGMDDEPLAGVRGVESVLGEGGEENRGRGSNEAGDRTPPGIPRIVGGSLLEDAEWTESGE